MYSVRAMHAAVLADPQARCPPADIVGMRISDLELARAAHATLLTELKKAEMRLADLPTGSAAGSAARAEVEAIRSRIAKLHAVFGASLRINVQQ